MILPLPLLLQVTPVPPLPPANLPQPDFETAAVLAPMQRLFAGIAAKDTAAILATVRAEGRATAVVTRPDGTAAVRGSTWADFAARIPTAPGTLEERLSGQPAVEVDGEIAMIWAPYVFLVDGKRVHCGTNHLDLVREGGSWRILNVTWTQRTTGCPE